MTKKSAESEFKIMKRLLFILLFTIIFTQSNSAQEFENLRKVDEFGAITQEDLSARLDAFTQELKLVPDSRAYIIVYKGKTDSEGSVYKYGALIKQYFKNAHNFDLNRIIINTEKLNAERKVELYITFKPPSAVDIFYLPKIDSSKSLLFDELHYQLKTEEYECCLPGRYDKAMAEASLKVFSELLKKYPDSKAYLISYLHRFYFNGYGKLDPPSRSDMILREYKNELIKNGIKASRIIAVKGGYRKDYRQTEVWFLPKDNETLKPTPNYFPKKKRSK